MTIAEHRECDRRVDQAWWNGYRFGWVVGLGCGVAMIILALLGSWILIWILRLT